MALTMLSIPIAKRNFFHNFLSHEFVFLFEVNKFFNTLVLCNVFRVLNQTHAIVPQWLR